MKTWLANLKHALAILLMIVLAFMTLEIVVRRWYWEQIPSQVEGTWVYTLLGLNALFLGYLVTKKLRPARS
jgi:hypothetical protein